MIPQVARLVSAGFALHWLHPRSKRPIGNDWSEKPVATLERLKNSQGKGNNIGVRLGKWSIVNGLYLHIIDVDIRVHEMAREAFDTLKTLLPELDVDAVPTVISGSGGESRHFYILTQNPYPPRKFAHSETFQTVRDEKSGKDVKKWDWELHLLGTGSQAVIPPSIHPDTGRQYRWLREFDFDLIDLGIADAIPAGAIERAIAYEEPGVVDPARAQPLGLTIEDIAEVLKELPADQWFEDRDQWLRVGMAIHHETGGSTEGFNLWCKFSKASEKFDREDSKRVWRSYKNRSGTPFRMASLVAVAKDERLMREFDEMPIDEFDDLGSEDSEPGMFDDLLGDSGRKPTRSQIKLARENVEFELGRGVPEWVAKLNEKHAIARVGSRTVVMDFQADGRVTYGPVTDLHNFYENDRRPKDDTTVPVTKLWMQHKHRRSYPNGIVFLPNQEVEGAYNHWQGFSVEPDGTKSCDRFLKHLREVFCNGDDEHYFYMLGWMAHMVQKPQDKPGVAIVARGKKRIGKDTVFEYVGQMFRHHYITIANKDQFVGKFNQHQEKCLLLHVQEGFWAGDKRDEGPLKYLITSRDVMIEPKGMNAFPVKSVLRLFISSNEDWVVPATSDEGRFFVVNVSDRHRNDHPYFEKLRAEMDNGGPAALLDFLQNYDISDFQVRAVPSTQALGEQKIQGLRNIERWWYGILQDGALDGVATGIWAEEPIRVSKSDFRELYSRWMRSRRYDGEELLPAVFAKRLSQMVPSMTTVQLRAGSDRQRAYVFPDLEICRREFEAMIGSELFWPEDPVSEKTVVLEGDDLG